MRRPAPLVLAVLAACGPVGPREVRGPDGDKPIQPPPPPRALLVAAEKAEQGGHLVVLDELGRRQRNLTSPPREHSADSAPAISADGRWVAFQSSRDRSAVRETSLWLVATGGDDPPRRLTSGDAIDVTPAWSPDGRTLAFGSTRGGSLDIWTLELDASMQPATLTQLTRTPDDAELSPAWSPLGDRLAWTAVTKGAEPRVMIAARDGAGAHLLVAGADPEWARDGNSIAYAARPPDRDDLDLFAVAPDGTGARHLLDQPFADETAPHYSADGRFLFATVTVRDDDHRALFSSVVCLELGEPATVRVLLGPLPISRLGVAAGPGLLDVEKLRRNPSYREALRRSLVQ